MQINDRRTESEKTSHPHLIVGTDRILSGWGYADGGVSYAAWACRQEDRCKVLAWVRSRGDMLRVREVSQNYRPRGRGHLSVYVVNEDHPALA